MDTQKIFLFTLALFCFDLSDSAPIFNGLLKTTNASNKYEDFRSEVSVISDNVTTYNVSKDDWMNNLTNGDLPLVLHGKSTFKKIVGKVKSWKNKITGGGGSNKVTNNRDGRKGGGGGGISVYRPVRPIHSNSDDSIFTYITLGGGGFLFVIMMIVECLKSKDEKDEDENTEKEKEDKNKDSKDVNKNENNENDTKEESEILKKDNKENSHIVENTAL